MIERPTTWGHVRVGEYVRDKTGAMWRVLAIPGLFGGQAVLLDRDGRKAVTPPVEPRTPVVVLEPTLAEAYNALCAAFGDDITFIEERPS